MLEQIAGELKALSPADNMLVSGDFNCVPDEWRDRFPRKYGFYEYNESITIFYVSNSLIDVWRHVNPEVRQ